MIELYNAIFNGAPYSGDPAIYDAFNQRRIMAQNRPDCLNAPFWRGNHVIILHHLEDFRWHKIGPYIGNYKLTHEYYSEEKNIGPIFSFDIYKVY